MDGGMGSDPDWTAAKRDVYRQLSKHPRGAGNVASKVGVWGLCERGLAEWREDGIDPTEPKERGVYALVGTRIN